MKSFRVLALMMAAGGLLMGLSGCATGTASLECAAESMNPTVMAALDSFETAAHSIKLSNRVLLRTPISEQDEWPSKLYGAPSGGAMLGMGLSLLGSSQGVTIALEIDPDTGFPRPTSALYLFLKDRGKMLNEEVSKDDVNFFKESPPGVIARPLDERKKPNTVDDNVYKNPLMAYGVVTGNKEEMLKLQNDIELTSNGFRECDAWMHKSKDGDVKPAACNDPALKDEKLKASLVTQKKGDLAQMEQAYGRLANNVYKASVAGADFTLASITKIGCAIVNGIRAFPNINKEFRGLKGAYNIAMLLPRIKLVLNSLGYYKNNLGLQYTTYTTMYEQIKGTYKIKDDEPTKQALFRIKENLLAMADVEERVRLAMAGAEIEFSDAEVEKIAVIAAFFPDRLPEAARSYLNL